MYYRAKDDSVVGVVNDFDLSITVGRDIESASERIGTVPFMAYALLKSAYKKEKLLHIYGLSLKSCQH
jgi:hypothetical protein